MDEAGGYLAKLAPGALERVVECAIEECDMEAPVAAESGLYASLSDALGESEAADAQLAIMSLVADTVRNDATADETRGNLEEAGLDAAQCEAFQRALEKGRSSVAASLAQVGIAFDSIVDIDWRLDYTVRTSAGGSVREPLYFVALKTRRPTGELGDIQFTCTLEQMQDFHSKVQDATRQVSRLLHLSGGAG